MHDRKCDHGFKKDDSGSNNKIKGKEESEKLYEQTKRKGVFCRNWKSSNMKVGKKSVMYVIQHINNTSEAENSP